MIWSKGVVLNLLRVYTMITPRLQACQVRDLLFWSSSYDSLYISAIASSLLLAQQIN